MKLWLTLSCCLAPAIIQANSLPGTAPLTWPEPDLSTRLMDGAHLFVERKIREAKPNRARFWSRDFTSLQSFESFAEEPRGELQRIIGAVDHRLPPAMEYYGDGANGSLVAETSRYRVFQARWPVLEGLWGSGLLLVPKSPPIACAVAVPDASQSPEQLLGLGFTSSAGSGLRSLPENGFLLVIPQTISRDKLITNDPQLQSSDQTFREWIYRQAFHMGRHVIGYEVQIILAAVDWLIHHFDPNINIGLLGYGEGGLTAFYSAAIDPRIDAALISGYFDSREAIWAEPIYRNVWGLLRKFGDAEIASLILPRTLILEYSVLPIVTNHKGNWQTPDFASVRAEAERIQTGALFPPPPLFRSDSIPFADESIAAFAASLGKTSLTDGPTEQPTDRRSLFTPASRHSRLVQEMENHVQRLVQRSAAVRDQAFLYSVMPELAKWRWSTEPQHPTRPLEAFVDGAKPFRNKFQQEAMGAFDESRLPLNARSRLVKETDRWKAYDVVLDVYPELFAWGLLVLPKDIQPGEQRPVVVCQHGRDGLPRHLLDGNTSGYRNIAATLANRGFVAFAPHNLYRGEDRYRWLDRKANSVGATLFTFIIDSHQQFLHWLEAQPFVDAKRIAFYGLSYGGETAMRVPPILEQYCLSICSGDFNQWTRKVAATDEPFSFMRTIEWEMPYWNLGHTFDYAEMAYLMIPRPFMVERGHNDLVGRDAWVAHEYAKVRWLYAQLGIADRTEITFFQGGHSMRAEATLDFLHRHLQWPTPSTTP